MFESMHGPVYVEGQVSREMAIRHYFLNHKRPPCPHLQRIRNKWMKVGAKGLSEKEKNLAREKIHELSTRDF